MFKLKSPIARNDSVWQGHPDVVCDKNDQIYIVWRESDKHLTTGGTKLKIKYGKLNSQNEFCGSEEFIISETVNRLNCPRISIVDDDIWVVCDEVESGDFVSQENDPSKTHTIIWKINASQYFNIEKTIHTNINGIVPDRLIKFNNKYFISTHTKINSIHEQNFNDFQSHFDNLKNGRLVQNIWVCDNNFENNWKNYPVADVEGLHLCEGSIFHHDNKLHCFMRENSGLGKPAYYSHSIDGINWSQPVEARLFGCHRPTCGVLKSGRILVTYREQSSRMLKDFWSRNLFAALLDHKKLLTCANILSLDHDRSEKPDGGYSGWTQLSDGRIFVVNYITDDAPKPYIRGYVLTEDDFVFQQN